MAQESLTKHPERDILSKSPEEIRQDFCDTEYSMPFTAPEIEEYARKVDPTHGRQIGLEDRFRYGAGIVDDLSNFFDEEVGAYLHEGSWNSELGVGYVEFSGGKTGDFEVVSFDQDEDVDAGPVVRYDKENVITYRASIRKGLDLSNPRELVQALYAPDRDIDGINASDLEAIGRDRYQSREPLNEDYGPTGI